MTYTDKPDYWSLLGLQPGSSHEQLKRAFRREARRWHPDLNINDSNAEERFKLVNEAYDVLSDPQKRSIWEKDNSIKSEELFATGFPSYKEYINAVLGIILVLFGFNYSRVINSIWCIFNETVFLFCAR